jgi:hypothetical protein
MIFPSLTLETVVQVEDKLRLDASKSFISGDAAETITDVLIKPEASESFITVFNTDNEKWLLDWAYLTDGIKSVEVKVITDLDVVGRIKTYSINVITVADDVLFSDDGDLFPYEPRLSDDIPRGKNSYIYAHRKAQDKIIAWLDEQRIWHTDGSRYTKQEIANLAIASSEIKDQFNMWSTFETLLIIFESNQVSKDDVFQEKKTEYESMRDSARKRSALRLDGDNDGVIDDVPYDIRTLRMIRR